MKLINMTALLCLGVAAFAQDVQFDYDRSANFNAYKTYHWVDYKRVDAATSSWIGTSSAPWMLNWPAKVSSG